MKKVIVFDFDGTLCHSLPLVDKGFVDALTKYGTKEITGDEIKANFGPNEAGILYRLVGEKKSRDCFYEYLRSYYKHHDEYLKDFFPGIRQLLEKLKVEGYTMYVLTGRSVESLFISLTKLDAFKYFDDYYYGGFDGAIKDELLLKLIKDHGLTKDEIIYVGDSIKDIEQCKKVGVKIISAAYDNFEKHDLIEELNPGMVANSVEELENLINKKCA